MYDMKRPKYFPLGYNCRITKGSSGSKFNRIVGKIPLSESWEVRPQHKDGQKKTVQ